ncbi:branched-chain amino acid ABC transporter permease [Actinophytocola sp.]|uniref:branched-chain amino acid ABC transporter permease n=1 Tax=Actinophytocola sp. TaxID=1872138 RepID=UPI003D6BBCBB
MELFAQQVVNSVMLGSTYALIAVGITLIYGVLDIAHVAIMQVGVIGALTMTTVIGWVGNYWIALAVCVVVATVVGMGSGLLVFRPLANDPPVNAFIAGFGLLVFLEAVGLLLWGPDPIRVPAAITGVGEIFGVRVVLHGLVVAVVANALLAALAVFLRRSRLGLGMRALAQDRYSAALMGISRPRIELLTMAVASAFAGLAAGLLAPTTFVQPAIGLLLVVKAFAIVVVGGMGSIKGALIAAYLLGFTESLGAVYGSPALVDFYALGMLLLVLVVRPRGFFGRLEEVR